MRLAVFGIELVEVAFRKTEKNHDGFVGIVRYAATLSENSRSFAEVVRVILNDFFENRLDNQKSGRVLLRIFDVVRSRRVQSLKKCNAKMITGKGRLQKPAHSLDISTLDRRLDAVVEVAQDLKSGKSVVGCVPLRRRLSDV